MSARQYLRKVSLLLGGAPQQTQTATAQGTTTTFNPDDEALDLSAFRVRFTVRRGDFQTPNSADLRIFNVSAATANRVTKEFTRVVIQAGYEGNFGLIFDGTIKQKRAGRLDAKDSYVDITAADGDEAYNFSPIAVSLAAGAQPIDAVQTFVKAMAEGGINQGYTPQLSTNGSARGRVYYGLTRDELRDFAEANDLVWSIQDGKLTFIPQTAYIPGSTPLISPATGLIGVPEQTQNGIEMRVLLNPSIKIGQLVKLDSTVNLLRFPLDVASQADSIRRQQSIRTNADGLYYVMRAEHSGDTRGDEWFSDLTCLAVDATVPSEIVSQGAIAPEAAAIKRY